MVRKKDGALYDLFLEIAKSSPWVSIPMALLLWANYHFGWLSPTNPQSPFVPLMHMLSYILVWMGAISALISVGLEIKRKLIFNTTQTSGNLSNLSWKDFEIYCQQWLKNHGYTVENNWDKGPDGGIDICAKKDGILYFVQCKHWGKRIGVSPIRELYGVAQAENAKAIFMVSSDYTQEALNFAQKSNVLILTGSALIPSNKVRPARTRPINSCPRCGDQLALRVAKKGPNIGNQFFGCSSYPKCRYTRGY